MLPVALSIAGSDPSGGAGIQADLKTFHRFGVYGEAAITLLTVQNTRGVSRVHPIDPDLVMEQIRAILTDIPPNAAKCGALGSPATVQALAELARTFDFPLVIDPVMAGKRGDPLLEREALDCFRRDLLPRSFLITPNLPEAAELTGLKVTTIEEMQDAARALADLGARSALVKGGHLEGAAVDILLTDHQFHEFTAERITTRHTHGTGCAYSAAITAGLAHGRDVITAIRDAKDFVTRAIQTNPELGSGAGPLNHWA